CNLLKRIDMYSYKITLIIISSLLIFSCKDFLQRTPKDELSIESTFESYNTIKTYSWNFYNDLLTYGINGTLPSYVEEEFSTDLMAKSRKNDYSSWIWQTVEVPASSPEYSRPFV